MISDLGVKGGFFFFFSFSSFPSLLLSSPPRRGLSALLGLDNAPFYCPAFAFLQLVSLQLVWVLGRVLGGGRGTFPAQKLAPLVRASVSLTPGSSLMPWGTPGWATVVPAPAAPLVGGCCCRPGYPNPSCIPAWREARHPASRQGRAVGQKVTHGAHRCWSVPRCRSRSPVSKVFGKLVGLQAGVPERCSSVPRLSGLLRISAASPA